MEMNRRKLFHDNAVRFYDLERSAPPPGDGLVTADFLQ
jgi:hypothetical protein